VHLLLHDVPTRGETLAKDGLHARVRTGS
jgi:hypothetical protein